MKGLVEKDTKTHSARVVSIEGTTLAELERHRLGAASRLDVLRIPWSSRAFVFASIADGSAPWFPDSASRRFRQLCARADVKGVRLHDLRHYVATRLLASGVDVRTVAGRLGDRNAATTLNVYGHFLQEADREAAERLEEVFLTALNGEEDSRNPRRADWPAGFGVRGS
jgi:integrase